MDDSHLICNTVGQKNIQCQSRLTVIASFLPEGVYLRTDIQLTQTYYSLSKFSIQECFLMKKLKQLVCLSKYAYQCATSRIITLDLF